MQQFFCWSKEKLIWSNMSILFTGFQLLLWLSPRYYSDLFDNGRSNISYRVVVVVLTFLLMSTREGWKQGDLSSEDRQRLWGSDRWRGIWSSYLFISYHVIIGLKYLDSVVVWANLTDDQENNGWYYIEITSNQRFPDEIQAKAAGFAEGYLTRNFIYHYYQGMFWINIFIKHKKIPFRIYP